MKRTNAFGATSDGKFFDGDPSLGIPATRLEETWLNNMQEEVVKVIEATGEELDGEDTEQLYNAILSLIASRGEPLTFTLNNDVSNVNLTGLYFSQDTYKSVELYFDIQRKSSSQSALHEVGRLYLTQDTSSAGFETWLDPTLISFRDDAGLTFNMSSNGFLQYTTNDFGTNHVGTLKVTDLVTLKK